MRRALLLPLWLCHTLTACSLKDGGCRAMAKAWIQGKLMCGAGVPLGEGMYRALSAPVEAWHFDMRCPPEDSGARTLDFEFTADGVCNAVVFWHTLQLAEGVSLSSAPGEGHPASGMLPC